MVMNLKSAEIKFILLKKKLNDGRIPPEDFENKMQDLRVEAEDGLTWQPRSDGAWLKWDGQAWQETGQCVPEKLPIGTRIFICIRNRALMIGVSMGITWVLHTYVLVFLNQGFNPSNAWGQWVNTVGNTPSSTIVWSIFSFVICSFVLTCITRGPKVAIIGFAKAPITTVQIMTRAGIPGYGAIGVGMGTTLLISSILRLNTPANVVLAMAWTFLGLSFVGQLATQYVIKAWFKLVKQSQEKFNYQAAQLIVIGLTPGFLACGFFSSSSAIGLGIVLLVVGVGMFMSDQQKPTTGQISCLLILGALTSTLYVIFSWLINNQAFADDGGSNEIPGGGGVKEYLQSEGAAMAIARAAPPAFGSGFGAAWAHPYYPWNPFDIPPGTQDGDRVWYNPPDDEGGWQWIDRERFDEIQRKKQDGLVWGGHRNGWVTEEQLQNTGEGRQRSREAFEEEGDQFRKEMQDQVNKVQDAKDALDRVNDRIRRRPIAEKELAAAKAQADQANSFAGQLGDISRNFINNVDKEIWDVPRDGLIAVGNIAVAIHDQVTDEDNWGAIKYATKQTANAVFRPWSEEAKAANRKFCSTVNKVGEAVVKGAVNDPIGFAKTILGVDDWAKVIDPSRTLGERIFVCVPVATFNTALEFAGYGSAKAVDGVKDAVNAADAIKDTANAADAVKDTANAADAIKDTANAADAIKDTANATDAVKDTANVADAIKDTGKASDARRARRAADNADDFHDGMKAGGAADDADKFGDTARAGKTADTTDDAYDGMKAGRTADKADDFHDGAKAGDAAKDAEKTDDVNKAGKTDDVKDAEKADDIKDAEKADDVKDAEKADDADDAGKADDADDARKGDDADDAGKTDDADDAKKGDDADDTGKGEDTKPPPDDADEKPKDWDDYLDKGDKKVDKFKDKVDELAEAKKSGNKAAEKLADQELKDAALDIKKDKSAIYKANKEHPKAVRDAVNDQMDDIYRGTDKGVKNDLAEEFVKNDLAEELSVPKEDIRTKDVTHGGDKIGSDRDITYQKRARPGDIVIDSQDGLIKRVESDGGVTVFNPDGTTTVLPPETAPNVWTDIPKEDVKDVYNKNFYDQCGDYPKNNDYPDTPKGRARFAEDFDQQVMDRRAADAYGSDNKDLQRVMSDHGEDFANPDTVQRTVTHKPVEMYSKADDAKAAGDAVKADEYMHRGNRELVKQWDKFVEPRRNMRDLPIPDEMNKAMNCLRDARDNFRNPNDVLKDIQGLGFRDFDDLAQKVGYLTV